MRMENKIDVRPFFRYAGAAYRFPDWGWKDMNGRVVIR